VWDTSVRSLRGLRGRRQPAGAVCPSSKSDIWSGVLQTICWGTLTWRHACCASCDLCAERLSSGALGLPWQEKKRRCQHLLSPTTYPRSTVTGWGSRPGSISRSVDGGTERWANTEARPGEVCPFRGGSDSIVQQERAQLAPVDRGDLLCSWRWVHYHGDDGHLDLDGEPKARLHLAGAGVP